MERRTVLVCPLNWGLGHASRCIPLIEQLLTANTNVIIAGNGDSLELLNKEFPGIEKINLPGFSVSYPKGKNLVRKMMWQMPRIIYGICREHRQLRKIIKKFHVDLVISDNRFGLWNKKTKCIFITHQIFIKYPSSASFEKKILRLNNWFISHFSECWIPDHEKENVLSGTLSHDYQLPKNACYIGPLSRFSGKLLTKNSQKKHDVAVILSGPEPQRSIFEELLLRQLKEFTGSALIIRGVSTKETKIDLPPRVEIIDMADSERLLEIFATSSLIICRSGYSSIMDLACLGVKAVLVPTPGQTEQEYLAEYLFEKGYYFTMPQDEFDLGKAIVRSQKFKGLHFDFDNSVLTERLKLPDF
ncbi:MAG: glycosyltransferase [Bacteroidota bacterium]